MTDGRLAAQAAEVAITDVLSDGQLAAQVVEVTVATNVGATEYPVSLALTGSADATFTHDTAASHPVSLDLTGSADVTFTLAGDVAVVDVAPEPHVIEGEFTVDLGGTVFDLKPLPHRIEGEFSTLIPIIDAATRVVLVDVDGNSIAELENAVVGPVSFRLNDWESTSFIIPSDDPKAYLILKTRLQEVQIWRGDWLMVWGPIIRAGTEGTMISAEVAGARWHLSRRHVGKANRDNLLCNPSFEQYVGCWSYLKTAYWLDFAPLESGDVRIHKPGVDGDYCLEINMDLQPWYSLETSLVGGTHTVEDGDTLWYLAYSYYGSGTQWFRIYDANQAMIQADAVAAGDWNPGDPSRFIYPGQVLTIPAVGEGEARPRIDDAGNATVMNSIGEPVITSLVSTNPSPADDGVKWGYVFAYQDLVIDGGVRGATVTLSAWAKVSWAELEGWAEGIGVMLIRLPENYQTNNAFTTYDDGFDDGNGQNAWGGARGLYSEVIEFTSSAMGPEHPVDTWVRHETSITVPPGETEIVHARLPGIEGRVYWDMASVTVDTAFEHFNVDQGAVISYLVAHAQDPLFDKNDINIDALTLPTDKIVSVVSLHSEHANIWDLIYGFTQYRGGMDIDMWYTPTQRIMSAYYPLKGWFRKRHHLQPGRNISSFTWSFDGESAATTVLMLGVGDGSDREEIAVTDATHYQDGAIFETVVTVGPSTPIEMLKPLAEEHLAVVTNPEILSITTFPHDPTRPERNFVGRIAPGDVVPVTIQVAPGPDEETPGFDINAQYRIIDMTLNEDDTFTFTLNLRADYLTGIQDE